jgi:hypothetical protein
MQAIYVILLTTAVYAKIPVLKNLVNIYASLFVVVMLSFTIFNNKNKLLKIPKTIRFWYFIYVFSLFLGFIISPGDIADFVKILLAPFFFLAGYNIIPELKNKIKKPVIIFLFLIMVFPLLLGCFELLGLIKSIEVHTFSIFSNRNNASLYAITLLSLYNYFYRNEIRVIIFSILIAILFSTLGVFIAVLASLFFIYFNFRNVKTFFVSISLLISIIAIGLYFNFTILERISSQTKVVQAMDLRTLSSTSYGNIAAATGTSDISIFFRLKHWDEIIVFLKNEPSSIFFGNGVGASIKMTTMRMVPHNDYLRLIFESGIFVLIAFLFILYYINKNIGLNYRLIPFLTVCIYFFSENLITNYLAMSIFYFVAGLEVSYGKRTLPLNKRCEVLSENSSN